jgi:hypothetical protein
MNNRDGSIGALRAIGALVLLRALQPVAVIVAVILIACWALMLMLVLSFSDWWLLLLVILVPITVVVAAIAFILWRLIGRILPRKLSGSERHKLQRFTETVLGIAESARTPYPVLIVLIAKDVLRGRESSFVRGLISDSGDLVKDFGEIRRMF